MYARVQFAAGGFGFGVFTLAGFNADLWHWKVLFIWIVVGVAILMNSISRFVVNDRRFQNERRIAALQTLPLTPEI